VTLGGRFDRLRRRLGPRGSEAVGFATRLRRLPVSIGYYRGPKLASEIRRRWLLLRHPHVDIRFEGPVYLGPGFSLHAPHGGSFLVGPAVEFRRGFRAELAGPESRISIGAGTRFTYSVLVQCGTTIDVGERVMFGQSTMVVDGNHRFRDLTRPMLAQGYDYRPLEIADDVTITTKCTIINSIGTRAFIGANSVVTRPIPAYTVAAGVPARVLDYFGPPGEEPAELSTRSETSG
jgi:acetyltransferase-like isoleucine patch superfamily enzyme